MKRWSKIILSYILSISLLLAPFPAVAFQMGDEDSQQIVYKGTAAVRISAVNGGATASGGAFVDNLAISALPQNGKVVAGPTSITAGEALLDTTTANAFYGGAIDLTAYQTGNYALRLRNTVGGGTATAYISATAPGGLEEATDVLAGWNLTSGWTVSSATVSDSNTFVTTANNGSVRKSFLGSGSLYKISFDSSQTSGTTTFYINVGEVTIADGDSNKYRTSPGITGRFANSLSGATVDINTATCFSVTMPVATGALLLSTKAGSRGFYSKDSTFDPNAAMTLEVIDISLTAFTDGNHSIELYPATTPSGRMMRGVLKAVGSGETYTDIIGGTDSTLLNGDMAAGSPPTGWAPTRATAASETGAGNFQTSPSIKITVTAGQSTGYALKQVSASGGSLIKGSTYLKVGDATGVLFKAASDTSPYANFISTPIVTPATITQYTLYGTIFPLSTTTVSVYSAFVYGDGKYGYGDDVVLQKVLTPSTSGSTIVSSKAGTTYNWAANTFIAADYNQASYYVVVKKIRGEVIMDTKTIDTGLALIDSTTANAFAAPLVSAAAYDFAAYRDSKHRLDIYSSAGVLWAQGYISSTAPSGLALGDELITSWSNNGFETFTSSGKDVSSAINTTGDGMANGDPLNLNSGELIYWNFNTTVNSGGPGYAYYPTSTNIFGVTLTGVQTKYRNVLPGTGTLRVQLYTAFAWNVACTPSAKRVTMPAATGALLLSTPGGARGYAYKHVSFDPNATGLVMKVVKVVD